jgi:hypothetical protein
MMINVYRAFTVGITGRGKWKGGEKKTNVTFTLSATNPMWIKLVLNLPLGDKKPGTNLPDYGKDKYDNSLSLI